VADKKSKIMDSETERNLNAECLALEMAGQTWHVPFDTLRAIPRVGETAAARLPTSSMNSRLRGHQSDWRMR
jgi:hypothetical protein